MSSNVERTPKNEERKYVLLDCDTGLDDAVALMMLLHQSADPKGGVETVGITCVDGNAPLDNVVMNNLRILKLYDQVGKVPVYKGCAGPMVGHQRPGIAPQVHGADGLGDKPHVEPRASDRLLAHVEEEHAVHAIVRLSREHAGRLTLIATAPLTNVAMACRLDPDLPRRVRALYIMGGTRHGRGNKTAAAEYNFYADPEAAYVVLQEFPRRCATHLIDWEFTLRHQLPAAFVDGWVGAAANRKQAFAREILDVLVEFCKKIPSDEPGVVICDALAMAVALRPDVASLPRRHDVCVELGGSVSRGHLVIDQRGGAGGAEGFAGPVIFYDGFDMDKFKQMLVDTMSAGA